ncbi:hypothetical protein NC651_020369 [Populus alba x Populus x berolinensis]|nr:hypothetical protein NC651_020369 [Populus alba x Populus x berolinensis]
MAVFGTNNIPDIANETSFKGGKRDHQVTVAFLALFFIGWYQEFRERVKAVHALQKGSLKGMACVRGTTSDPQSCELTSNLHQNLRATHHGSTKWRTNWSMEVRALVCSYDGHWKLTWSLTSGPVGLVEKEREGQPLPYKAGCFWDSLMGLSVDCGDDGIVLESIKQNPTGILVSLSKPLAFLTPGLFDIRCEQVQL